MSQAADTALRYLSVGARWGRQVAADPAAFSRAAGLLLRGSPRLAAWVLGWATTEFPLQVLAGHALGTVGAPPLDRLVSGLAAQRSAEVLDTALREVFGQQYLDGVHHPLAPDPSLRLPASRLIDATRQRRRYTAETTNIAYGPAGRDHLLDIWRRPGLPEAHRAPVLLQIPGGAWAISEKRGQAYPLMNRMAELGWICVTINYSRSPFAPWPQHLIDVKRAVTWVRRHITEFGGDPDFIAVTGGSAGAHLGSLAALTAGDRRLQPGFETADTSVQAVVPHYGVYDLTDTDNMHDLMMPFLEQFVLRARLADSRDIYEAASPITHVHRDAPPFLVLHGRDDAVIPSRQAESFVTALRRAGASTIGHAELPNAHHAFDTMATVRSQIVAEGVARFLGTVYGRYAGMCLDGTQLRTSSAS